MAGSSVIGALRVNLGLDAAQLSTGIKKANADIGSFHRSIARMAAQVGGVLAGAFTVKTMAGMADQWSDMSSRVGVALKSMQAAPEVMERISKIANMTYSPLSQTADGFVENNASMRELGYTTNKVLDYTEALNNALVVSGAKGERAASVQRALSVAMSTGKLSGDGLNSVLSNGGRIAEALAKELGTSRNGLIALGSKGKITADIISKALLKEMEALREEAAAMPATIGDGFTLIGNSVLSFVGRLDQATGATANVAGVLASVAEVITAVSDIVVANIGSIQTVLSTIAGTAAVVASVFATKYAVATGVTAVRAMGAAIGQSIALEMALGAQSRSAAIAGVATKALSGALAMLRGAIIATGIGALVVGAGYLIAKFVELVRATGGLGNALSLLGEVASGVWNGIIEAAGAIIPGLGYVWAKVQSAFYSMIEGLSLKWLEFVTFIALSNPEIAGGYDAFRGIVQSASKGVVDAKSAVIDAEERAAAASSAASNAVAQGYATAGTALAKLNVSVAETAESIGSGEGSGLGGRLDQLAAKSGGAAGKLSKLQEVMKRLREEAEKMAATSGMSELQASIWETQREAGVGADSAAGKQIAAYQSYIDKMKQLKDASEEWRQSIKGAFSDFITQGGSFKNVIGQIIGKLGEMMFSKGFDGLWGVGGGGALGGIFGSIPKLLGFSNGTNFAPGGLARINERGGEIVNLPRGSQVIPHDISKRMADRAGGAQSVHVTVGVDQDTGNLTAFVDQRAGQAAQAMGRQIDASLPARFNQIQANPRRR